MIPLLITIAVFPYAVALVDDCFNAEQRSLETKM